MEQITMIEGLGLSAVAIIVVMLVLAGLMGIVTAFKYLDNEPVATPLTSSQASGQPSALVEDEESKTVAALMALIMANQDQQDKKYRISSIKRIK